MKRTINFFLLLIPFFYLGSLEKRSVPLCLKTSVIIPCDPHHFNLLEGLLTHYDRQTRTPDEIVISLSNAETVGQINIGALEEKRWGFTLKILPQKGKFVAGANRNAACQLATGDLVICQDADDLPHPQRVEIIAFLFENYQLEHLIHQWIPSSESFKTVSLDAVSDLSYLFQQYAMIDIAAIHNGSVSFMRDLFSKVHWKPMAFISEDVIFNQHAYAFCKHKAVLKLPLIQYRFELSAFDLYDYN
jgi:glycosyltransferase involved in cell wall biosynthesis